MVLIHIARRHSISKLLEKLGATIEKTSEKSNTAVREIGDPETNVLSAVHMADDAEISARSRRKKSVNLQHQ